MEHEVKKVLKVYKTAVNKNLSFWKKLQEIGIDITIIVFAVSLSIWLHERSEHSHQQLEVRQFMQGLKQDLSRDVTEMQEDRKMFILVGKTFQYICTSTPGFKLNVDSIKLKSVYIFNTVGLISHNGMYESFKSSGKLSNIENQVILSDITNLYQSQIPSLLVSTNDYTERKKLLFKYLYQNEKFPNTTNNLIDILSTYEAKNLCSSLIYVDQIVSRYTGSIETAKTIISIIDADYNIKK